MIRCENISKQYLGRTLFSDLSLTIGTKERIALLGRNGSGKSTLFRLIAQEEELDSGTLIIPKGYRIGKLHQHAHFTKTTALQEAIVATLSPSHSDDDSDISWEAEKMLSCLGFTNSLMQKHPESLSGGYTLRLQLAKLLLSDPNMLLLDEPTNYLDIKTIAWLKQFLQKWPKELIAISHNRDFLDSISTHTAGIHRTNFVKIGGKTQDYFRYILEQEEQYQKMREKVSKEKAHLQKFVDRFGAKATKAKQAQSKKKLMEKLPELQALSEINSLAFSFQETSSIQPNTLFICANEISFRYGDSHSTLFSSLNFSIASGEIICIAGQNGKGKSTLLKLISGELHPTTGYFQRHPSCKIGYFGQTNIDRLHPESTIEEEIASANMQLNYEDVRSFAAVMMFTKDETKKKIKVLSGGEKSRVLLAKILASPVNILLLDEPTNHLDMESIEALCVALETFSGAVFLITHDESLLARLSTRLILFDEYSAFSYLNTYSVFLQEQGWDNAEKDAIDISKGTALTEKPHKEATKETLLTRQMRAKNTQERSKSLKPILQTITQIENEISELERKKSDSEQILVDELQRGISTKVEYLSKIIKEAEAKVELLFLDLEKAYDQKHRVERAFQN